MRAVKWAAYVIGGLIGLIALILIGVLIFVDPNKYRDDIQRIVDQKTGRHLTIEGKLKLSVFPWIALETGALTLGEAPGFGTEPFIALKEARVGVRLLPLLTGRVEVSTVQLVGARVRLITDEQGRHNWADLGSKSNGETQQTTSSVIPTVAGVIVKDASITIEDHQAKTRKVVRDLQLKTGRFASGERFDLTFECTLDQEPTATVHVKLDAKITADLAQSQYRLDSPTIALTLTGQGYPAKGVPVEIRAKRVAADTKQELYGLEEFRLSTTWQGEGLPAAGLPIELASANLQANLQRQTLDVPALDLQIAGAHLSGRLTGEDILDAPKVHGPLKLDALSLREWLPKVGVTVPQTRDAEVLKALSFSGTATVTKTSAEVGDILLKLDDTTAKGSIGIADFAAKALRFDLNIDHVNADRYLPPPDDAATAKKTQSAPTPIPVDALRTLNARGQVVVRQAIFAGMTFSNLRLGVTARDGKVRFNPSEASMYGGQYHGDIGIDATGNTARVSLDEHVTGVDFAPLFKDLFKSSRVSGKGSANIVVSGTGRTTDEVLNTMSGNVDFKVLDGALEGADLWYEIRRARALLRQQALPERSGPARTPFTAMTASGAMTNGVLATNDLNVAMQYLKVNGQGSVNVPASTLDYRLIATVLKIPSQGAEADAQDLVDAQIPVRVTGALSDPKVRPDVQSYLTNQVKKRVEQQRDKVEQKVKDKLGDKLKDLLGH
jgi:AsmA protein